jgi:predicted dehydrogenase
LGAIGAGGFGLFALQQLTQLPGVRLTAMARTHREPALRVSRRFGIPVSGAEALACSDDVDLVYISTPPFLHYTDALLALQAGKHVICEKPLALSLEHADELIATAKANDRLLVVNLMQRYNPVADKVRELVSSHILGELLHATFENYASDEGLPPDHWFWDRDKSGGIFVEHGVHFFDLFEYWLGRGTVEAAQRVTRPGSGIEEQVQCVLRFGNGALVTHYHGFTQASRMDRQEFRLLFEQGDVRLSGWVPTHVRVDALLDESATRALTTLFPAARTDVTAYYTGRERAVTARHRGFDVYQRLVLNWGEDALELHRYGELIRAFGADQLAWIRDRSHARTTTEQNARRSLELALTADDLARRAEPRRGRGRDRTRERQSSPEKSAP